MKVSKVTMKALAIVGLMVVANVALASTSSDTQFDPIWTQIRDWAQGSLGKTFALAGFVIGAGAGIIKSSPLPAVAGIAFALFMVYLPTIIISLFGAVI